MATKKSGSEFHRLQKPRVGGKKHWISWLMNSATNGGNSESDVCETVEDWMWEKTCILQWTRKHAYCM